MPGGDPRDPAGSRLAVARQPHQAPVVAPGGRPRSASQHAAARPEAPQPSGDRYRRSPCRRSSPPPEQDVRPHQHRPSALQNRQFPSGLIDPARQYVSPPSMARCHDRVIVRNPGRPTISALDSAEIVWIASRASMPCHVASPPHPEDRRGQVPAPLPNREGTASVVRGPPAFPGSPDSAARSVTPRSLAPVDGVEHDRRCELDAMSRCEALRHDPPLPHASR
jgi:hypothetical protein